MQRTSQGGVESVVRLASRIELIDSDECSWTRDEFGTHVRRQRPRRSCASGRRCQTISATVYDEDGAKVTRISRSCL